MAFTPFRKYIRDYISQYLEDLSELTLEVEKLEKLWKVDNSFSFIYGFTLANIRGYIVGYMESEFDFEMSENLKMEIEEILLEYSDSIKDLITQKLTIVSRHDY